MLILALFPYKCAIQGFQVIFVYTFIYPRMYKKHLFYLSLYCLTAFSCATVPLPLATIPQKGNTAMAAVSAGWNGANVQAAYATKKKVILSLSFQFWGWNAENASRMLDAGLGVTSQSGNLMGMLTMGYGRQSIGPWSDGLLGSINQQSGSVSRWSGYILAKFSPSIYFNLRISNYKGSLIHYRNGPSYLGHRPTLNYSTFGIEPALFGKFGKFSTGVGGHMTFVRNDEVKGFSFRPWTLWCVIGFKLGKKW